MSKEKDRKGEIGREQSNKKTWEKDIHVIELGIGFWFG